MSEGAPFRLNKYMSRPSIQSIILSLKFKDGKDVEYDDGLFHMWQMEKNGTCTCLKDLIQSRINALNKSMMEWFKKYEPGFMCVGRKPHPFDNERHTICCGLPSMLWRAQIV